MANTKISAETAASALDGTELYEGVQSGVNVKVTGAQIKTLVQSGLAAVATSGSAADLGSGTLLAARMPALTGDVTTSAGAVATTIAAASVTLAKMANLAASSIIGNNTGSPAVPLALTAAQVKTLLAITTADVASCGTVTSVSVVTANGVSGSVATSTTTPAITVTLGAITPSSVAATGAITSNSASAGIGYATGAGGTVTQITSRTTGVTLSKTCGAITLFSAAGSATWATFTVTNTQVAATDTIEMCQKSGANLYNCIVTAVGAGSFNVSISAVSGTATESPVFNFVVIKAVTA